MVLPEADRPKGSKRARLMGRRNAVFFTDSKRNYGNKGENEENKRSSDQRVKKVKRGKSTYKSNEQRCPKWTDQKDQKE